MTPEKPMPVTVDPAVGDAIFATTTERKKAVARSEFALQCWHGAKRLGPDSWFWGTERHLRIEGKEISVRSYGEVIVTILDEDLVNLILSMVQRQLLGIAELERG